MKYLKYFENFDYYLLDTEGNEVGVSKDEFVKAGAANGMDPKQSDIKIDPSLKKVVARRSPRSEE